MPYVLDQGSGLAAAAVSRVTSVARLLELLQESRLIRGAFLNRIRPLYLLPSRARAEVIIRVRDVGDYLAECAHGWRRPIAVLVRRREFGRFGHPTAHLGETLAQRQRRIVIAGLLRGHGFFGALLCDLEGTGLVVADHATCGNAHDDCAFED